MPDPRTFLLPARAYLLSMRDQNIPLRRTALDDTKAHYDEFADTGGHAEHIALVALIGEMLAIIEDVAALANSFYTAPEGTAFFAALTRHDDRAINNFLSSLKKRPPEDFLQLLGLRFGEMKLEDAFIVDPPFTAEEHAAITEAHEATAAFVAGHLVNLAEDWERYRRFGHAFRHGLLVPNHVDVQLVGDDDEDAIDGVVVWVRRKESATGFGHIPPPLAGTAEYVVAAGNTALDVLEHLVDSRLRIFDLIDLDEHGSWVLKPLTTTPWCWWLSSDDLSSRARELLAARFRVTFV
jgi:hypothetical protein